MNRPNFPSRTQLALLCGLLALLTGQGISDWDSGYCDSELERCNSLQDDAMVSSDSEERCNYWDDTLNCFTALVENCPSVGLAASSGMEHASDVYCTNCAPNSSACTDEISETPSPPAPTPTSTPPTTEDCTGTDSPSNTSLVPLGTPSLTFPPSPTLCTLPDYSTYYRQHCSAFTLSHIRPFGDSGLDVQTCFLPGSWYLLKHQHLTVAVGGTVADGYTYISQVNVTFLPHPCSPEAVSYVATTSSLPTSLPDDLYAPYLHLTVENETMATILAPWINTTLVIRRAFGYLTVTLQVPEPLTRSNEVGGLCRNGCPAFTQVDVSTTVPSNLCPQFTVQFLMKCVDLSNGRGLSNSHPGYSQVCGYDVGTTRNLSLLSLFDAYVGDALLLPDVTGGALHSDPTSRPTVGTTQQLTETSSTSQDSIVLVPHTTSPQVVARAHTAGHLNLLLLLFPCLVVWWLR